MGSFEAEKTKTVQDKCQNFLAELLRDEDNKYCVDCDAKSPRWASWNLGIFLCIRCAGIHRNLGVHISKVKSVNLDTWTPQQVACVQQMGNSRARAVYEANLPDSFRRPQTDSALEQFIRGKYEAQKYIAREWVPPPMPNPTWHLELEKQMKKKREKAVTGTVELPATLSTQQLNRTVESKTPMPLPKAPGGKGSPSSARTSPGVPRTAPAVSLTTTSVGASGGAMEDLLGLDASNGITDSGDAFGDFLTAPMTSASSIQIATPNNHFATSTSTFTTLTPSKSEEESFFNQKIPESDLSNKLSSDSILALYANRKSVSPSTFPIQSSPNCYMNGTGVQPINQLQSNGVANQHNMRFMPQMPFGSGNPAMIGGSQPGMIAGINSGMIGTQHRPTMGAVSPMMNHQMPIQLSAANPFAQMHQQMTSLNMSSQLQQQAYNMQSPMMVNTMQQHFMAPSFHMMPGGAMTPMTKPSASNINHVPNAANNLWQ